MFTYAKNNARLVYDNGIVTLNGTQEQISVGLWPNVILVSGTTIDARSGKLAIVSSNGSQEFYHLLVDDTDQWMSFRLSKRTTVNINSGFTKIKINEDEYLITNSYNVGNGTAYTCEKGTLFISKDASTWEGIGLSQKDPK